MIKKFAQSHPAHQEFWYETTKGERKNCSAGLIHLLWQRWIIEGKEKQFENGFTVFEFEKPVMNERLKNWIDEKS